MHRLLIVTVLAAAFLIPSTAAYAGDARKADAMKRIEMLRIWRLTEILELNETDGARIFPILQKYDRQYMILNESKEKLVKQLKNAVNTQQTNAKRLETLTGQLIQIEQEAMDIRGRMYTELKEVLTPQQLAKYMIFEINFKQEIDEIINQVRREHKRMKTTKQNKKYGEPGQEGTDQN